MSGAALALVLGSAAVHALWNGLVADAEDTHAHHGGHARRRRRAVRAGRRADLGRRRRGDAVRARLGQRSSSSTSGCWPRRTRARTSRSCTRSPAASAPVIVLVVSVVALGAGVSAWQAAGVLAVAAGVVLVRGLGHGRRARPRARARRRRVHRRLHARRRPRAAPRRADRLPRARAGGRRGAVRGRRGPGRDAPRGDPPRLLAGAGMFGAYALALAALELAEAAPVAALRETSVVMAAVGAAAWGARGCRARGSRAPRWSWRGPPRSRWVATNGAG